MIEMSYTPEQKRDDITLIHKLSSLLKDSQHIQKIAAMERLGKAGYFQTISDDELLNISGGTTGTPNRGGMEIYRYGTEEQRKLLRKHWGRFNKEGYDEIDKLFPPVISTINNSLEKVLTLAELEAQVAEIQKEYDAKRLRN